jgi:hypothetical protein
MLQLFLTLIAVGCAYVVYKLVKLNSQLSEFPGPKPNFVGGTTEFITNLANIHIIFTQWAKQFNKVFKIRVVFTPHIVVGSARIGKEILLSQNNYSNSFLRITSVTNAGEDHTYGRGDYLTYRMMFGEALQNTDGDAWAWR